MSWEKSRYTTAGAALLSESLSGGALTITRAVSGTNIVETDLSAETTVSGDTHELTLLGIDTVTDGGETARRIRIRITGAEKSYIMHQIGVYGRLNDDSEVLLFIMQDERGIEVPASSVNAYFEIEIAALLAISADAKINITVSPEVESILREIDKRTTAMFGIPCGIATLDTDGHLTESQRWEVDSYKKAETDQRVSAAVDAHNSAAAAHSDIRARVAAMNASIKAIELKFSTNVTKNPFSTTFGSLDGLTVTGVWNAEQTRIEF